MKLLITTFSFLIVFLSFNWSVKSSSQIEVIKAQDFNITKDFVLGKFDYKSDSTFTKVNPEHSVKEIYIKSAAYNAFIEMFDAAKRDSINLKIISGTRNYNEQKIIWERKWENYKLLKPKERALKILNYSSMPSSSRHHWGTDIDLNSLRNSYFSSGKGLKQYEWLKANANKYGFYQVYTEKNNVRTGHNLEKWHWSYLPLSSKYLKFYNSKIVYNDISGFKGDSLTQELKIIKDYVNGISDRIKDFE